MMISECEAAVAIQRRFRRYVCRSVYCRTVPPACDAREVCVRAARGRLPDSAKLAKLRQSHDLPKLARPHPRPVDSAAVDASGRCGCSRGGDPSAALRFLNGREATLADEAAGLHVRFRLSGEEFPPSIVYKVFTHRPVADIGAFGPRNYATAHLEGQEGWYVRVENNPWRRVDGGNAATCRQVPWRHFASASRRTARRRERERRALQWLAWRDSEDDADVDALVSWTEALDFGRYLREWHQTGCVANEQTNP